MSPEHPWLWPKIKTKKCDAPNLFLQQLNASQREGWIVLGWGTWWSWFYSGGTKQCSRVPTILGHPGGDGLVLDGVLWGWGCARPTRATLGGSSGMWN